MSDDTLVIHVVDDDDMFRKAIGRVLRTSGYEVALYDSPRMLLERLPKVEPGCILLDVSMPGLSGLDLHTYLNEMKNALPVIFLTGHGDIPMSVRAIKAGADDFLSKPVPARTLTETIERALNRYRTSREQREKTETLLNLVARLSSREREVFSLFASGKLNKQIAFDLGTSERTIKAHRHSIMQKLGVRSVAEAVSLAERVGLLGSAASSRK